MRPALLILLLCISACGQKGDLYLPEEPVPPVQEIEEDDEEEEDGDRRS